MTRRELFAAVSGGALAKFSPKTTTATCKLVKVSPKIAKTTCQIVKTTSGEFLVKFIEKGPLTLSSVVYRMLP